FVTLGVRARHDASTVRLQTSSKYLEYVAASWCACFTVSFGLARRSSMSALKGGVLRLRRPGSSTFSGYKKADIAARHVAYDPIHFHSSSKFGASRVNIGGNRRDSQSCKLA